MVEAARVVIDTKYGLKYRLKTYIQIGMMLNIAVLIFDIISYVSGLNINSTYFISMYLISVAFFYLNIFVWININQNYTQNWFTKLATYTMLLLSSFLALVKAGMVLVIGLGLRRIIPFFTEYEKEN